MVHTREICAKIRKQVVEDSVFEEGLMSGLESRKRLYVTFYIKFIFIFRMGQQK